MTGPLGGTRVVDLSAGIAGPMTTMLLADHGADVVKVEPPGGDPTRSLSGAGVWHRGKRSITLDVDEPADRERLHALVDRADVVVDSFAPGVAAGLGLDWDTLRTRNPRLVLCSITAYGRHLAERDRPAVDALVAARTGLHWEQRGRVGTTIGLLCDLPVELEGLDIPTGCADGPDRDGPCTPGRAGPASAPPSWPPPASAPRSGPATTPAGASGSRPRCSRAFWPPPSADGSAPRTPTPTATSPGSSTRAAARAASGAPTAGGCRTGCRTRRSRWACPRATTSTPRRPRPPARTRAASAPTTASWSCWPTTTRRWPRPTPASTPTTWVDVAAEVGIPLQPLRSPRGGTPRSGVPGRRSVIEVDDPELGPLRQVGRVYELAACPTSPPAPAVRPGADAAHRAPPRRTAPSGTEPAAPSRSPAPASPLAGIRVIDLGLAVAGPWGTMMLADLGAEVIKVNTLSTTVTG